MVVLSACETGTGEFQRGEGIISLARAFSYAGAKSIVTSLWSINDQSSYRIMDSFYKNLQDHQTIDQALMNAKRTYLQQNNGKYAHPAYWSAFIPIGDMNAVKLNTPLVIEKWIIPVIVFCLVGLLISSIIFYFKRRT